ncbi:MAG: DEAD/DEAH box helicase [Gammaproteobacteria bacterium]|nr:DEAD/DEAH box helicase [Gammaproteobacteria bacterium]
MSALRPYQTDAVARLESTWNAGGRAPILVAPTGSGKTVIAVEIIRREIARGGRVLFLAPRRELVEQAADELEAAGILHGVLMAGDPRRNDLARMIVASIDTLRARSARMGQSAVLRPDLVIVDECHLFPTKKRTALISEWPQARIVGLTATPARMDGRALGAVFDSMIDVATVAELTAAGYLVPARYFTLSDPDLAKVRTTAGDFNVGDLAGVMDRPQLVGDVAQTWLARAGERRTVVFAVNIGHSVNLAAQFRACGVSAEHVDANTPTAERAAIFGRFRSGATQVLTNCSLASYGFSLPDLDCVVIARPTKSLPLYLQMVGRGLRPAANKRDCFVLDHSGTVRELGFADDPRAWSLEGRALADDGPASKKRTRLEACNSCRRVFRGTSCPSCGVPGRAAVIAQNPALGELVEIARKMKPAEKNRLRLFLQLRGECQRRGMREGAAAHTYRELYGVWPPKRWSGFPMLSPSDEAKDIMQQRIARYRREREALS